MKIQNAHDLGLLIRQKRQDLHLTQAELAVQVGVGRTWLNELENGKRTAQIGLTLRILSALGIEFKIPDSSPLEICKVPNLPDYPLPPDLSLHLKTYQSSPKYANDPHSKRLER